VNPNDGFQLRWDCRIIIPVLGILPGEVPSLLAKAKRQRLSAPVTPRDSLQVKRAPYKRTMDPDFQQKEIHNVIKIDHMIDFKRCFIHCSWIRNGRLGLLCRLHFLNKKMAD
jgi:hypothetical protein